MSSPYILRYKPLHTKVFTLVCKGLTSIYLKTKGKHMYNELPCGVWDHCWQTASVGMRKQH